MVAAKPVGYPVNRRRADCQHAGYAQLLARSSHLSGRRRGRRCSWVAKTRRVRPRCVMSVGLLMSG